MEAGLARLNNNPGPASHHKPSNHNEPAGRDRPIRASGPSEGDNPKLPLANPNNHKLKRHRDPLNPDQPARPAQRDNKVIAEENLAPEKADSPQLLPEGTMLKDTFRIKYQLGAGGFGQIYVAEDCKRSREVAVKAEALDAKIQFLKMEQAVMRKIQGSPHAAQFLASGVFAPSCNYLVMSLLGRNVMELKKATRHDKFTIETALRVALQMLRGIKEVHSIGYIHRDIKPSNFAIGQTADAVRKVYILDFGLCRSYVDVKGFIRKPRDRCGFRGTVRYASLNIHHCREMGRHDDLWSLAYVLVEIMRGSLPWRRVSERDKVRDMKEQVDVDKLTKDMPEQVKAIYQELLPMKYYDKPPYDRIEHLLETSIEQRNVSPDLPYDWELFDNNNRHRLTPYKNEMINHNNRLQNDANRRPHHDNQPNNLNHVNPRHRNQPQYQSPARLREIEKLLGSGGPSIASGHGKQRPEDASNNTLTPEGHGNVDEQNLCSKEKQNVEEGEPGEQGKISPKPEQRKSDRGDGCQREGPIVSTNKMCSASLKSPHETTANLGHPPRQDSTNQQMSHGRQPEQPPIRGQAGRDLTSESGHNILTPQHGDQSRQHDNKASDGAMLHHTESSKPIVSVVKQKPPCAAEQIRGDTPHPKNLAVVPQFPANIGPDDESNQIYNPPMSTKIILDFVKCQQMSNQCDRKLLQQQIRVGTDNFTPPATSPTIEYSNNEGKNSETKPNPHSDNSNRELLSELQLGPSVRVVSVAESHGGVSKPRVRSAVPGSINLPPHKKVYPPHQSADKLYSAEDGYGYGEVHETVLNVSTPLSPPTVGSTQNSWIYNSAKYSSVLRSSQAAQNNIVVGNTAENSNQKSQKAPQINEYPKVTIFNQHNPTSAHNSPPGQEVNRPTVTDATVCEDEEDDDLEPSFDEKQVANQSTESDNQLVQNSAHQGVRDAKSIHICPAELDLHQQRLQQAKTNGNKNQHEQPTPVNNEGISRIQVKTVVKTNRQEVPYDENVQRENPNRDSYYDKAYRWILDSDQWFSS